ncbi:DUF4430 domain-containing protein [Sporolactobacillus nakayamae]|uniref:Transcobalamin-like C-terminal domain-containing protein n=1 Tax=Sporolactobacillus nakayamae TaxID=269670 RepID=A0A1I2UCG5_9BACL|nr:DUF4430 domain-containing protein [Sporolactobacillus nakayamae]SFG74770.1 protein of unknown function [Sporolactobacillus nakayamae]
MKFNKIIVLIVSIGLIIFGTAFIAGGFQTQTVTVTHVKKADGAAQADQTAQKPAQPTNDTKHKNSREKNSKSGTDSTSSVNAAIDSINAAQSVSKDGSDLEGDSNAGSESKAAIAATESTAGSEQKNTNASDSRSLDASSTPSHSENDQQKMVTVAVNGYDHRSHSGQVVFKDGMTAFDALKQLMDDNHIELDYSGFGPTAYVKSIDGQRAGDQSAQSGWTYEVNGKEPNVSAGIFKLHAGDLVKWIYRE